MYWIRRVLLPSLMMAMIFPVSALALDTYRIELNKNDFAFSNFESYTKIQGKDAFTPSKAGYPELPIKGYKYYLPSDIKVIGIRIIRAEKEKIPGEYVIYPTQKPEDINSAITFTPPDTSAYSSKNPYPGQAAYFSYAGFFRGHQIADIVVFPFEYVPASKQLYFYSTIEFEFVRDGYRQNLPIARRDSSTIEDIKSLVQNKDDIMLPLELSASKSLLVPNPLIPFQIITNAAMKPAFDNYALYKIKKGIRTEVETVENIQAGWSGNTLQDKIRSYINFCYTERSSEYVLLGGDVNIIPAVHCWSLGDSILTDMYYSCLNGDWNANGNSRFGETPFTGDNVDYYPEVYVGRIPCSTLAQAQTVINKIFKYESFDFPEGCQKTVLLTSSDLYSMGDGQRMNASLASLLPGGFNTITYHNFWDTTLVEQAMEAGVGIMINTSHSQGTFNYLAHYVLPAGGSMRPIYWRYLQSMNTHGQYPLFINRTCNNNNLDSDYVVSRAFMISDSGGGIAYVGSTAMEWANRCEDFIGQFLGKILGNNNPYIGKALGDSKTLLIPTEPWIESFRRYSIFSYNLLGDPQMQIWSDVPNSLGIMHTPGCIRVNTPTNLTVLVTYYAEAAVGISVCLSRNGQIVGTGTTGVNGTVVFNNVNFNSTGYASIVISGRNNFVREDSIVINTGGGGGGGGGGCPMLYAYNGSDYQFINNILAHSEDPSSNLLNQAEDYPIYDVPITANGLVKLQIREDEKEKSKFNRLAVQYIQYPADKRVVYTNRGEFHFIAKDSLLPISATDNQGNDVLDKLAVMDNNTFSSSDGGYLIIKYALPSGAAKISDYDGGVTGADPGEKEPHKVAAYGSQIPDERTLIISVLDKSGNWREMDKLYPRVNNTRQYIDLSGNFIENKMAVKLEWKSKFQIDYLPFYFFDGGPIEQTKASLSNIRHSANGDISAAVASTDGSEVALSPGERIDIELNPIQSQTGYLTAVVLESVGKYERISDSQNSADGFAFDQNYPNPFNATTKFLFSLPTASNVNLSIFNILGQKVIELTNTEYPAGRHEIIWNGEDASGHSVSSGIYFAKIAVGDKSVSRRIVIVK